MLPQPNRLDDENDALVILDQSLLPGRVECRMLRTTEEIWEAIRSLRVRGAPAIGVAAAYGAYLGAKHLAASDPDSFYADFRAVCEKLATARPTAVNLFWALSRMDARAKICAVLPQQARLAALREEAKVIHREDIEQNRRIGELGLSLLHKGDGLLTHCNAGPIATSCYGTALAPILLGQERGYTFRVFADETRPLLQGARLTSLELMEAGVDVTLICDNMASLVMKNGWVQACLVGCDRVAANGDTANKIGTSGVAVLAKHYGIPFYVLGPTTTLDLETPDEAQIPIEQRAGAEITDLWYAHPMAPAGVKTYNPAFDVTEHALITAIITERGIAYPPYTESLRALMG
ncbi:MAG: S-methyl-5-thioribose-1-phosphate isomerase [Clostridiaceae bacterium]|nr:S-methyl-5-thioribose-1-phosphate isomerase [Clostridiaceae bacterium]